MNLKNIKTAVHALTVALATLTTLGTLPGKAGLYVTIASSAISFLLNVLTRLYPEAAA